jgi:hypothetical protein
MKRLDTRTARGARDALGVRLCLLAVAAAATALAAGCATATAPPGGAGAGTGAGTATATKAAGSPAPSRTTPVPTTTAGPPSGSVITCTGWPAHVTQGRPPASFTPTAVERCLVSDQPIPGKGEWETATLERADSDLGPLMAALRRPSTGREPGMMCPELAVLPPDFVLIGPGGAAYWPIIPVTGCGLVQQPVLDALAALSWQKVSVHLVTPVKVG